LATKDVARELDIDPANASTLVTRLERRRLVRRDPATNDRRKRLISLTTAGRKMRGHQATVGNRCSKPPLSMKGAANMQITKNSLETTPGPSDWFTGAVYIDTVATPSAPSRLGAARVHFTPGARTAWHTHPFGQTIYVTEGVGLCQRRGGPIEAIRPGDRVFFEPGEDHWHGAAHDRLMTHLAMQEADDQGSLVTWGEHVTDEEYDRAKAAE
jgi:quercetin dioxygenase-like cupin family protein